MFNQKKVTDRRIFKPIRMLSILFFAVLIPFTGYTADLDVDLINAVLQADTAAVNALLAKGEAHPIEEVGGRLRAMMPWLKKDQLVDKNKN